MQKLLDSLDALREALEDLEPKTDTQAWMLREFAELLARARGILAALVADEEQAHETKGESR